MIFNYIIRSFKISTLANILNDIKCKAASIKFKQHSPSPYNSEKITTRTFGDITKFVS